MSLLLGVNIDHVATLRQARYALQPDSPNAEPSPASIVRDAKAGGADSITIHVRVDRRHMQDADAYEVKNTCDLPINLEMGNTPEMLALALDLSPEFVCLVPETREEVTTEGGLDVHGLFDSLQPTVAKLREAGIKVSMFIDPDVEQVEASARIGAEMVELHTGCFANAFGDTRKQEVQRLTQAANKGHALGVQVNAGHGINYTNIVDLYEVPHFAEFNIGHSIVARSVKVGFETAVAEMVELMKGYQG
ncbi:pyridoxine 5'-phosphate synthase [Rubritalea marina]|uniref:pyridoxine 5'-phosphate synthase n=1 Tax=Rubritalea marina TaxID=361055 RepID=UPI00037AE5E9|nr:pyridoxine 5'-phosphate synthase [Rubritalea marina]